MKSITHYIINCVPLKTHTGINEEQATISDFSIFLVESKVPYQPNWV